MKAIVDPAILGKELKKIAPVVGKNQVMPILECVILDFRDKKLKITGTDLHTWITHTIPCEMKTPFVLAVSVSDLIEICDKSPGPITIVAEEKQTKFLRDNGTVKLPIYADPVDFPSVEEVDYFKTIDVSGDFFYSISGANVCASKDPLKPHMQGVGLDFKKDSLSVVGIDGFHFRKKDFVVENKKPFIVAVNSVFCGIVKTFQDAKLSVSDKFVKVEYNDTTVVSRLAESKFVDYSVAISRDSGKYLVRVDRKELINALSRLTVAADKATNLVRFIFQEGAIKLYCRDEYKGKESDELIFNTGEAFENEDITMNGKYLTALLGTINEDAVLLNISSPTTPIYIKPEGDDTIKMLIMPSLTA